MALPTTGDLLLTATNSTDFNSYEITAEARYVKLLGYGRFNSAGNARVSVWSAVGEIEFYGDTTLSVDANELANKPLLYPIPANDLLHLKNITGVTLITVYGIDGKKIMDKMVDSESEVTLDVSSITNGSYIVTLKGEQVYKSKLIIISH